MLGGANLPRQALERCVVVSDLAVEPAAGDVLPALFYSCLRRARIWDRPAIVTCANDKAPEPESPRRFELTPLHKVTSLQAGGTTWTPVAQRVDIAIHLAWMAASSEVQGFLREQLVGEAVETLERWIVRFFKTPYFQAVYDGTMTKEQYVYGLSNMHQFVRWTTRLCGLAVSHSHDRTIRNKWLEHLQGEINHEMIIEKDLQGLNVDIDYLVNHMVPSVSVQAFMVAQESAIAFHRDPILFMAAPFVAEGFTARLDQRFIDSLRRLARGWGAENPKLVTAFWASHIEYDGGDDGHWENSRKMLELYLQTDRDLLKFLNIMRLACNAFERSYSSYVEDLAIFGAAPVTP